MIVFDVFGGKTDATDEKLQQLAEAFAVVVPETKNRLFTVDVEIAHQARVTELNREHRGKDEATDVLSFPTLEYPLLEQGEEVNLGSIVLDPHFESALAVSDLDLIFHGTLHLLGFDHEADRAAWDRQESAMIQVADTFGLCLHGIPQNHE